MPYKRSGVGVEDATTVISNETGGILRINCLKINGQDFELGVDADGYGESVDLETIMRPSQIEHSGIDQVEKKGMIKFHPKPASPDDVLPRGARARKLDPRVTRTAPPNNFDVAYDEMLDRDKARDEDTAHGEVRRSRREEATV